ncbi:hypothetical protein JCM11251_001587 [Rhodosporidiobolus azoricus]
MKALPSLSATASAAAPTRSGSLPNALVSSTTPPASEEPSPTDLLLATPPTLLKLFALCAPAVHAGATFVQLLTWTHPNFFGSLLVLLGWWGLCLFGRVVALYGVNAVIFLLIARKYLSSAPRRGANGAPAVPPSSMRHRARPATLSPAAYAQLINSANILAMHVQSLRSSIIHPLSLHCSFTPLRPSTPAPAYETAWLLITSYPFYLLLTYLVSLRYIFLTLGSVAILWQAPFFTTLRLLVWRSAFVRWTCRLGLSILKGGAGFRKEWSRTKSGLGVPGLIGTQDHAARRAGVVEEKTVKKARRSSSVGPAVSPVREQIASVAGGETVGAVIAAEEDVEDLDDEGETEEGEDVQVQFTVFENQRWWVGLDWTHALLPGERASWTDPANNPANPPSSFTLPPPSVAYIPSPTRSDPTSRLKKTTEWRWLDPEWKVLRSAIPTVTLPITSPTSGGAVGPPPSPIAGDDHSPMSTPAPPPQHPASPTISRIAAAAGVQIPPSLASTLSSNPSGSEAPANPSYASPSSTLVGWDENSSLFAAWTVDDEGWQYGDNHFEKMGPRGGLGKYTRRRAWVRRAGLVERTERVSGAAARAEGGDGKGKYVVDVDGKKEEVVKKREGSVERSRKAASAAQRGSEAAELVRRSSSKGGSESLRRRKSLAVGAGGSGETKGSAGGGTAAG